jgi:hypothetical protein
MSWLTYTFLRKLLENDVRKLGIKNPITFVTGFFLLRSGTKKNYAVAKFLRMMFNAPPALNHSICCSL